MSLTTSEMTPADFAAVTGNNNGGFGNGDGAWWLIVLFLFAAMGGWGNGNGFGGNNGGGVGNLYPWLNQQDQINDGFRDQMLNTTVNGIQQGVNNLSTQLCNCCGDMQMALANGFAGVEQGANARQMAMNGYSNDGSYEGSYDMMYDGRSNARNGRMNRGSYARNRDARGRYSRRGYSRDGMVEELEDLMNEASTEQEKEAIRRCIEQMR